MTLTLWAVPGLPEITAGADLAALVEAAARAAGRPLRDGDVLAVASKIVAKAEGRTVPADRRDDAIDAESVRLVAARSLPDGRVTRVVLASAGPVMAAAGVDASDVAEGTVLLLPADPDASARRIRAGLLDLGVDVGVLVTDTSGRVWRAGVADFTLGAAGVSCLDDRRGHPDASGRTLSVTVRAVADEIAAAADLVKGKSAGTPVAVVRGLPSGTVVPGDGEGGRSLVRSGPTDWFRTGHVEAVWAALDPAEAPTPPDIDPFTEPVAARLARATRLALSPRPGEPAPDVRAVPDPSGAPDLPAAAADASGEPGTRAGGGAGPRGDRVVLTGSPFDLGRAVERLLTAAWAEDLALTVTAPDAGSRALTARDLRPSAPL